MVHDGPGSVEAMLTDLQCDWTVVLSNHGSVWTLILTGPTRNRRHTTAHYRGKLDVVVSRAWAGEKDDGAEVPS